MNRPERQPTPAQLVVVALDDPLVEALGHRPGSPYIEYVWLPVLGPSATWAFQRLSRLAATRTSITVDSAEFAAGLGISPALGANSVLSRTLWRLSAFGAAQRNGDTLAVRRALPDVPLRRVQQLPVTARYAHQHLAAARRPIPSPANDHQVEPSTAVSL